MSNSSPTRLECKEGTASCACGFRVPCRNTVVHFCNRRLAGVSREVPLGGPGTELKKLLKTIGIIATPNCSCNARARTMDANGCDWCEANIDTIVGWLREEATKRRLPFIDAAGRLLVRRAIANARKSAPKSA